MVYMDSYTNYGRPQTLRTPLISPNTPNTPNELNRVKHFEYVGLKEIDFNAYLYA